MENVFESVETPILDLYKRIDVYSFGIFLLEFLYNFLKNETVISDISNDDKTIKLIVEITKIIEKCCVLIDYNGKPKPPVNFNLDILNAYKTVIKAYISGLNLHQDRSILVDNILGLPTSRSSHRSDSSRSSYHSDHSDSPRSSYRSDSSRSSYRSYGSYSSGAPSIDSSFGDDAGGSTIKHL